MAGGSGYTVTGKLGAGAGGGGAVGGQAGGYASSQTNQAWGGGGGSGATASHGVSFPVGEAGSYATGGYTDTSRSGTPASGNPHDLTISPPLTSTTSPWSVGYSVTGTGIPAGTTIKKILSTTSVQLSNQVSGSSAISLTVTSSGTTATSVPGGASDFYYTATTLPSALLNAGTGGAFSAAGTAQNGTGGAVVLLW
jgi:hypothetical protein